MRDSSGSIKERMSPTMVERAACQAAIRWAQTSPTLKSQRSVNSCDPPIAIRRQLDGTGQCDHHMSKRAHAWKMAESGTAGNNGVITRHVNLIHGSPLLGHNHL